MAKLGNLFKKKNEVKTMKFVETSQTANQEEIMDYVSDIEEYFISFRDTLLRGEVDFTRLQNCDIAILSECRLNLGISLPTGYTCDIDRLDQKGVCYRIVRIDVTNDTLSYQRGKLISKSWSDFDSITVNDEDIDVESAVRHLASKSHLSLICTEEQFEDEVNKLIENVKDKLTNTTTIDFDNKNFNKDSMTA